MRQLNEVHRQQSHRIEESRPSAYSEEPTGKECPSWVWNLKFSKARSLLFSSMPVFVDDNWFRCVCRLKAASRCYRLSKFEEYTAIWILRTLWLFLNYFIWTQMNGSASEDIIVNWPMSSRASLSRSARNTPTVPFVYALKMFCHHFSEQMKCL